MGSAGSIQLFALATLCVTVPTTGAAREGRAAKRAPVELDSLSRMLPPGAALPCKDLPLVVHRGTHLRYHKPLRVHRQFLPRLEAFEQVVVRVAVAHYGRAPRRIVHMGGYNCRRMRTYPDWLSEHALGNAIDVAGFDFGRAKRDAAPPQGAPRALRRAFSVRIDRHWRARRGAAGRHAAFLHALARELIERRDVFSVVLGPGWPGHHNHLHLDAAPYRSVEVDFPSDT